MTYSTCLCVLLAVILLYFNISESDMSCTRGMYGRNCRMKCNCLDETDCTTVYNGEPRCRTCKTGFDKTPTCQQHNIAFNRSVQSQNNHGTTSNIVDGNRKTCSNLGEWFEIDLGDEHMIRRLDIDRSVTEAEFKIYISNVPRSDAKPPTDADCRTVPVGHTGFLDCLTNGGLSGRYIIGINTSNSDIRICELIVWECSDFTYGANCEQECSCFHSLELCNKTTGICPSGCQMGDNNSECSTVLASTQSKTTQTETSVSVTTSTVSMITPTTFAETKTSSAPTSTVKSSNATHRSTSTPARSNKTAGSKGVTGTSKNGDDGKLPLGPVVGGAVGGVVILVGIAALAVLLLKCKRKQPKNNTQNHEFTETIYANEKGLDDSADADHVDKKTYRHSTSSHEGDTYGTPLKAHILGAGDTEDDENAYGQPLKFVKPDENESNDVYGVPLKKDYSI